MDYETALPSHLSLTRVRSKEPVLDTNWKTTRCLHLTALRRAQTSDPKFDAWREHAAETFCSCFVGGRESGARGNYHVSSVGDLRHLDDRQLIPGPLSAFSFSPTLTFFSQRFFLRSASLSRGFRSSVDEWLVGLQTPSASSASRRSLHPLMTSTLDLN